MSSSSHNHNQCTSAAGGSTDGRITGGTLLIQKKLIRSVGTSSKEVIGSICLQGSRAGQENKHLGGQQTLLRPQTRACAVEGHLVPLLGEDETPLWLDSKLAGGRLCHSVFVCALLALVVLGRPAASSLPLRSLHRGDRGRTEDLYWPGAPPAFAESHEDLGAPAAAEVRAGNQESRGSAAAEKREGGISHPAVVDPFSAAQVLSANTYKKQLLAQVHLHKGLSLSDEGKVPVVSAETESPLSPSIKKGSSKEGLTDRKQHQRPQFPAAGDSLLELGVEKTEEPTKAKEEEEAQLLVPSSFASRDVAPHWPLFAEDASDLDEGGDEENTKEQQQQELQGSAVPALPPKERQAASLVESSSSAEEEGGDSQDEQQSKAGSEAEEQEGESEGAETEGKLGTSKSEKQGSATEEASSTEETDKGEKHESGSETETDKHVSKDKDHEGESSEEKESGASEEAAGVEQGHHGDKGDKGDTEEGSQDEASKQSSRQVQDVETSAAQEKSSSREEEGSKEEGASKKEAASEKESHAAESAAEHSGHEKPETTSAAREEKEKHHGEHEETHSASASKGSSSKGEEHSSEAESKAHADSGAAAATLALKEMKEKEKSAKHEQQKKQEAAETPHVKTEEEKAEEHRKYMKDLAERATKLANIQRMEDQQQHRQLEEATKTAQSLTAHLRVQHELKKKEMALKQKEIAHLNLLKHLQVVMQSAVSTVWTKLTGATLKRLVQQSTYVNKRFLRETDNRVLRPQELPKAVMSEQERKREGALAKKQGVSPLDCPVECAPKTCDNKPSFPTHCFRYDLVAGGGGFRTCAPFTDEATAACPESYTRCAMAAPVRGRQYELLASRKESRLPCASYQDSESREDVEMGCLGSCVAPFAFRRPTDAQSVQAAIKDSQAASGVPPPRVLEHGVASPGEYKLCMLQFWMPPEKLKGDVIVLGVDEIGSVRVQDVQAARRPVNAVQAETAAEAAEKETIALETLQPLPLHKPGVLEEKETETAASTEEKLRAASEVPGTLNLHPSPPKA
ncbi:hypothetical protein ACSSS7_004169 [Eimeria intestinalis]